MKRRLQKSHCSTLLLYLIIVLTGVPTLSWAQDKLANPTIEQASGQPVEGAQNVCIGSVLSVTVYCSQGNVFIDDVDQETDEYSFDTEPATSDPISYTIKCQSPEAPQGELPARSSDVLLTINGFDCPDDEDDSCPTPSSATNFQAVGNLNGENCSIQLSALVTGKHFEFTGPNGYVFSHIFRYCQENIEILAKDVKQPGVYTLKVYTNAPVPRAVRGEELPEEPFITYTLEVGGTACQNPR